APGRGSARQLMLAGDRAAVSTQPQQPDRPPIQVADQPPPGPTPGTRRGRAGDDSCVRSDDTSRSRVVHVAPAPVLVGLGGLHDGMGGVVEVLGGVLADRGVAAADVPALEALPQRDPLEPLVEAALAVRLLDRVDDRVVVEVGAGVAGTPEPRVLLELLTLLG